MGGYRFVTLGCRLNQAESDLMAEELGGAGLERATDDESPELVVVNTCTVTKEATKASRMALRRAVTNNPSARVVAIGCYAESDPDEITAIDGVDVVLGNAAKESFLEALAGQVPTAPLLQIGGIRHNTTAPRVRANLKVQTGCDEWCAFCIIPKTRGPLRSMEEEALVTNARRLVFHGTRELVLTGVHLGKYRFEAGGDEGDLIRLLERLLEIEDLPRVRLSSILSDHLTDEVIDLIATEPRICRYLHVPLQAGHDDILEAMHRPYRIADFMDRVEAAKQRIPGLALATDVIVGFPSETEAHFQATLDVVERVGFSKLHVFRYSPRAGTAAAAMTDVVDPNIKKDRSKRLIALGNRMRSDFLNEHLERPLEVLVEDERVIDGTSVCSGQTSDYVRVWFDNDCCFPNDPGMTERTVIARRDLLGRTVEVVGHEVRADGIRGGTIVDVAV